MKKTIMFMMALFVSMLCVVPVYAADTQYAINVEEATAADSLLDGYRPFVSGVGTEEVTVTVDGGKYKILDSKEGEGVLARPTGYTWVGLKFTLPKEATDVKIGEGTDTFTDSDPADELFTFTEWFGFNIQDLTDAAAKKANVEKSWTLNWKVAGESYSQKIKLVVEPATVEVEAQGEETVAWGETEYLAASSQKKLTYHVVCPEGAEVCTSGEDFMYYAADAEKEDVEAQLRLKVIGESEELEIKGIYTDEEGTTAYDFEKDLEDKPAYVLLAVKEAAEENPSTGDNVLTYAVMGTFALVSVLGTAVYFKKVNE